MATGAETVDLDAPKNKRRAKGTGGVHQRKDGYWIATIYVEDDMGKVRQVRRAAKTEAQAHQRLRDLHNDKANGKLGGKRATPYTMAEWLNHWIEEIHHDNVSPNTYDDYCSTIRNYLVPYIGTVQLADLSAANIRALLKKVQKEKSTRSAQKAHNCLRTSLDQAVNDELIDKNVCRLVPYPKHVKKQRGAYEDTVVQTILEKAGELDANKKPQAPLLASRWETAFLSGAREGECLGLEWDRVLFDEDLIDVSWQLQRLKRFHGCGEPTVDPRTGQKRWPCGRNSRPGYCPKTHFNLSPGFEYRPCHRSLAWTRPKSQKGKRWVPMVPELKDSLSVHFELTRHEPNPHNLVWHYPDGRPISQEDDNQAWNMLIASCGIEKKAGEVLLHEARNTTATRLLEDGVDAKVIQEILGHVDILTTRDYQKVRVEFAKKAVAGLGALLPKKG
ncbi:phage-related integrase [Mycobacteroides abscessus subsp. abscessus]|nr:phage-related integrase [Mycobacteroides abscessus subsp. abscessus]